MAGRALKTFGKVDILVSNAGIPAPIGLPFTNNVERDWDRVYQVNVKAIFLVTDREVRGVRVVARPLGYPVPEEQETADPAALAERRLGWLDV